MSRDDDYPVEMPSPALDDHSVDAFLSGRSTSTGELGSLAAFAEDVRVAVDRPVPAPNAALATLLTDGIPTPTRVAWESVPPRPSTQAAATPRRRKLVSLAELLAALTAKLAGLGMASKAALGLGIAATSVTGAGAAGILPDPAQHAVATAVSATTPFEISDPDDTVTDGTDGTGAGTGTDDDGTTDGGGATENHGSCVSEIARTAPRGPGGQHGEAVSTAARSDCGKASSSTSTTIGSTTSTTIDDDTTTTTLDDGGDDPADSSNRGPGSANSGPGNGNGNSGNGNGNSGNGNSGNGNSGSGNSGSGGSGSGPGNSGKAR